MINTSKNLSCAFADDLVSYLYGEMDLSEMGGFETHLSDCADCTEEFADLSLARLGVYEWNRDDFRHLKTPFIEIPYSSTNHPEYVHSSWLDALRGVFATAPKWAAAGGAFAILAVGLGITLIASNLFRESNDLTEGNNVIASELTVINPVALPSQREVEREPALSDESATVDTRNRPSAAILKSELTYGRLAAPASTSLRNRKKTSTPLYSKEIEAIRGKNVNKNPGRSAPPQLSDFRDEEDRSLRLADLFADVDAGR